MRVKRSGSPTCIEWEGCQALSKKVGDAASRLGSMRGPLGGKIGLSQPFVNHPETPWDGVFCFLWTGVRLFRRASPVGDGNEDRSQERSQSPFETRVRRRSPRPCADPMPSVRKGRSPRRAGATDRRNPAIPNACRRMRNTSRSSINTLFQTAKRPFWNVRFARRSEHPFPLRRPPSPIFDPRRMPSPGASSRSGEHKLSCRKGNGPMQMLAGVLAMFLCTLSSSPPWPRSRTFRPSGS